MDRRIVGAAIVAFLMSRVLLFALLILGSQVEFLRKSSSNSIWETRIVFNAARVRPEVERLSMVGDAWWYRSIALDGYDSGTKPAGSARNWAFFPLYPLLLRTVHGTADFALSGSIVSNVAFLAALLLLGMCGPAAGLTVDDSTRAVFYAAFFPTSYFASLPQTEGLFLALSIGSIVAGFRGRWATAGVLGMLAALTRLPGILLIAPLAVLFFQQSPARKVRTLWLLLVPCGTAAYMTWLYRHTGDPLAFIHAQASWQRHVTWSGAPLLHYLAAPANVSEPWNFALFNALAALLLIAAAVALLALRQFALGAYTLVSVLLILSGGSLQSVGRYAFVVFPLFLWLGIIGRRPVIDKVVMTTSAVLFGWFIALFTLRIDFALA